MDGKNIMMITGRHFLTFSNNIPSQLLIQEEVLEAKQGGEEVRQAGQPDRNNAQLELERNNLILLPKCKYFTSVT